MITAVKELHPVILGDRAKVTKKVTSAENNIVHGFEVHREQQPTAPCVVQMTVPARVGASVGARDGLGVGFPSRYVGANVVGDLVGANVVQAI